MATQWLRRAWLAAAGASVVLLAACGGGGDTESELDPARIVVFGDAMADIGQNAGGTRYTVNDGKLNNWTLYVAEVFGNELATERSGGTSWAVANARVAKTPGAAGDTAAQTVVQQVDEFLAGDAPGANDLILLNAGHSDIIVNALAVFEGSQTEAEAIAAVTKAGEELGGQVRRLVEAGARHVVVAGAYNLGRSPWAKDRNAEPFLEEISRKFNDGFKVVAADLGETVLYVDFPEQVNRYEGAPGAYAFEEVERPVCNSRNPGAGIGTGTNQIDSSQCTRSTLINERYDAYLFADRVYLTPRAHRLLGEYFVSRVRNRW